MKTVALLYALATANIDHEGLIYTHMITVKPTINRSYAGKLANKISKAAKKHDINPILVSAILMQESTYRPHVVSGDDYGIAQINKRTAKRFGIADPNELVNNIDLSLDIMMRILWDFKSRRGQDDKYWWTRYNCGAKPTTDHFICKKYRHDVGRFL